MITQEHGEFQKRKLALNTEYVGICDRLEDLELYGNVVWREVLL